MELVIGYSIALVFLLCGSLLFSSADMAYGSLSLSRLERDLTQAPSKKGKRALALAKHYDRTISTILLWNDAINAGLDSVSTLLGIAVASTYLGITNPDILENYGLIFSMSILVLKIIFGEIIAKSMGKLKNLSLAKLYSYPLSFCLYFTFPITFFVGGLGQVVSYPFLKLLPERKPSEEGLEAMIEESEELGTLREEEAEFLRGTMDYATAKAYEIMTPRVKVYAVEEHTTGEEILEDESAFTHTRIPVYRKTIDDLIGYITLKDLIRLHFEQKDEDIHPIIRPILFFGRSEEASEIYNSFRKEKEELAAVLDEYGGFEGVITKEDIVEEVVGEIWDETDHAEEPLLEQENGDYIVDGSLPLEEIFDELDLDVEESGSESETLGGFLTEMLTLKNIRMGASLDYEGYRFMIVALGARRAIRRVKIVSLTKKDEENKEKED